MFQEWKVQLELFSDSLDNIKCYFADFARYFTYIGKLIWNVLMFVLFPIWYMFQCLYLYKSLGTYKATDKFMNNLYDAQGKLEKHSFESLLNRGLPNKYKSNINKWVQNNQDKIYDCNIPSVPEGELRI